MSQQALIALADTAARIGYDEAYDYVTALYGSIASAEASAIEAATSADEALSYKVAAETAATQAAASAAEAEQDFDTLSTELAAEVSARITGDAYLQGQVGDLDARTGVVEISLVTVSAQADSNTAAITAEQTARADADSAEATARLALEASVEDSLATVNTTLVALASEDLSLGQRIDTVEAEVDSNHAAVTAELTALATEDLALAGRIDAVQVDVDENAASILTESQSRATADGALSLRVDVVEASSGDNAAAITAEETARTTADTALGSRIDMVEVSVGDNTAAITAEQTARTDADSAMASDISGLTTRMGTAETNITTEITARTDGDTALGSRIDTLETEVDGNAAAISSEQTARASADTALGTRIDTVEADVGTNEAAIASEVTARTDADTALGVRIDTVEVSVGDNTAAITAEQTARADADTAIASDVSSLTTRMGTAETNITNETTARTSADTALGSRIDSVEVDVGNNETAITNEATARASADSAIADDVTTLTGRVTDAEGDISGNITAISGLDGRLTTAEGTITSHTGSITSLQASVNTLPHVYLQDTEPTGGSYNVGDMWLDSSNSNKPSVWDGTIWGPTSDLSGATVYAQDTAPAAGSLRTGDLWLNTTDGDNILHRWNGGAWVDISDPRIAGNASAIETMDATVTQQGLDIVAVANRATSLETRAGDLEADVATIETAYADADEALGTRLDTIEVRMPVGSGTLATSASVTNEESARVSADSALSGRVDTVEARMPTGVDLLANEARVVTAENTAASATDAVSGRVSIIEARVPSGTDLLANESRVVTVESAFASADSALSSRVDTVEARMPLGTGELATSASVATEQSARVSGDGALSGRLDTIEARMPTGTDDLANEARVVTAETAAASATQAVADRTTILETAVNDGTTGLDSKASITDLNTVEGRIDNTGGGRSIEQVASALVAVEGSVNDVNTGLATKASVTDLQTVENDLDTLTGTVSSQATDIQAVEAALSTSLSKLPSTFEQGGLFFTNNRSGAPESVSQATGAVVTDGEAGSCLQISDWSIAGHNILTRGVLKVVNGHVYRMRARLRVEDSADGSVNFTSVAAGMTNTYASQANAFNGAITITHTPGSRSSIQTFEVLYKKGGGTGYYDLPAGVVVRGGLRLNSSEAGLYVRVISLEWEDITEVDANVKAIEATNATVSQHGDTLDAHTSSIATHSAQIADKAEASVVEAIDVRVSTQEHTGAATNLLTNSTFNANTANDPFAWAQFISVSSVNLAGASWHPPGVNNLGFHQNGVVADNVEIGYRDQYFPAEAGKRYCASAYIATHRGKGRVEFAFYDAAGTNLGSDASSYLSDSGPSIAAGAGLDSWDRKGVFYTAPAGAVQGRIILMARGNGSEDPYVWFARPMVAEVSVTQTEIPAWNPGGNEASATYSLALNANGKFAGVVYNNDGTVSNAILSFDNFTFESDDGSTSLDGGVFVQRAGGYMYVTGPGIGAANDILEWFGPNMAVSAISKTNAITYKDITGTDYRPTPPAVEPIVFNATSSSTASPLTLQLVNTDTDGGNKAVTATYYFKGTSVTPFDTPNSAGSATLSLWRKVGTGSFSQLGATQNVTITDTVTPGPGGKWQHTMEGSVTLNVTDTNTSLSDHTYEWRLTARSTAVAVSNQTMTLKTVEG